MIRLAYAVLNGLITGKSYRLHDVWARCYDTVVEHDNILGKLEEEKQISQTNRCSDIEFFLADFVQEDISSFHASIELQDAIDDGRLDVRAGGCYGCQSHQEKKSEVRHGLESLDGRWQEDGARKTA